MSITISFRGIMGNIIEQEIRDVHSLEMSDDHFKTLMTAKEFELAEYLNSLNTTELRDLLLFDDSLQNKLKEALRQVEQ